MNPPAKKEMSKTIEVHFLISIHLVKKGTETLEPA